MIDINSEIADAITPELTRIAREVGRPRRVLAACGRELEQQVKKHFTMRDATPNAKGFPRKHFWANMRKHTAMTELTDTRAVVSIDSPELAHKLEGGTIVPKRAKALSIPLSGDAYKAGSASLFPRPLTMVNRPGKPPLLVETGVIGKSKKWHIHYILLKSVTHRPDPDALPKPETISQAVLARGRALLDRVLRARSA